MPVRREGDDAANPLGKDFDPKKFGDAYNAGVVKPIEAAADRVAKQKAAVEGLSGAFKQLGAMVNPVLVGLAGLGGLSSVAAFNPGAAQMFTRELRNLSAAVGQILQPVLESATAAVKGLNVFLTNLSPTTKALAASLAAGTAAALTFSKVVPLLSAAVSLATQVITADLAELGAGFSILDVLSGGILPIIGTIATVAIGAGAGLSFFGDKLGGLGDVLSGLKDAFDPVMEALSGLGPILADSLGDLSRIAVPLVQALAVQIEALGPILTGLVELLGFLQQIDPGIQLIRFLSEVTNGFRDLGPFLDAIRTLFLALGDATRSVFRSLGGLVESLKASFASLGPIIQSVFGTLLDMLTQTIEETTRLIVTATILTERLQRGQGIGGLNEEVNARIADLRRRGQAGGQTFAAPGASVQGIGTAGRKLQEAAVSAGKARDAADAVDEQTRQQQRQAEEAQGVRRQMLDLLRAGANVRGGGAPGFVDWVTRPFS